MVAMTLDQFKVVDGIVKSVPINMVDNLRLSELPTYVLLHDMPVLKDSGTIREGDFPVTIRDNSTFSVEVPCGDVGISESLESLIVDVTEPFGFMGEVAPFNGTDEIGFSLGLSLFDVGISMFPGPLEVHGTHSPASGRFAATSNAAFCGHSVPPSIRCDLFFEIAHLLEKRNGKHRVNSGNPKFSQEYGNPEPSRKYTFGRCRDYRRDRVPLITGKSARLEREDIVRSSWKHESTRGNRSDPEKVFIVAYNSYSTASLTNGQAVMWDYA